MQIHRRISRFTVQIIFITSFATFLQAAAQPGPAAAKTLLPWIRLSEDSAQFVSADSGRRFVAWGFNYDHDDAGRLIEDYWHEDWPTIVQDFKEMKALGANVVRIHPQLAKFMETAEQPDQAAIKQLVRLVRLAEKTGLYLDITGLGCYHKNDVPEWYDKMSRSKRWEVQARFWEAIAKNCARSPAVFCYDLMNEPILPRDKKETDWLAGEFGGKYFVQRIALDLAGRTRKQLAKLWVDKLVSAIRKHDKRHMITVGVIPWAHTFPNAKPLFYSKGEVDKALQALAVYDIGKPLVIEECAPLYCGVDQFDLFVDGSRKIADGFIGFYWGKTIDEYTQRKDDIRAAIMAEWLQYFNTKRPHILESHPHEIVN